MKKFNFGFDSLPVGSIMLNRDLNFFEKNRVFVNSVFTLSPVFLIFIVMLLYGLYKKIVLEAKLKEQNDLDGVLLNNIQSAIFWQSYHGALVGCNQKLCNMLKKDKSDIIGKQILDVIPFANSFIAKNLDNFEKNRNISYVDTCGQLRHFIIRREKFERGIVTIMTDITDKKRREDEYKRHEQFVLQRSKQSEVGEILASIAHQWKTPLIEISAIAQSLTYAIKKNKLTQESAKSLSDDIMKQIEYMTQTIDDFRAFIKPSTEPIKFNIDIAIKQILHILDHTLKYNYIDVQITNQDPENINAYGYLNEFKQTLLNIINNAKDAILEHKGKNQFIKINVSEDEHSAIITIEDSGGGIDTKSLPHIFDPFYSTKSNGDGFGLYMAKLIIEDKMGGKISVENSPYGAKFTILLEKNSPNR